jgi:hypothetical protein
VRGEGFADLVVGKARRQPRVRGRIGRRLCWRSPLTIALRARRADDEVVATLSPRAGRGGKRGEDRVEHTKGVGHDLGIPEAQDAVVCSFSHASLPAS